MRNAARIAYKGLSSAKRVAQPEFEPGTATFAKLRAVSFALTTTPLGLAVNYCLDFELRCVTSRRMAGRASCPLGIWDRSCRSSPAAFLQILRRDYCSLTMQLATEKQRARQSQGGSIVSACCVLSLSLWLTPPTSRLCKLRYHSCYSSRWSH